MLQLNNITKDYISGDTVVNALKGISISFREHEFVSILGQSGCAPSFYISLSSLLPSSSFIIELNL